MESVNIGFLVQNLSSLHLALYFLFVCLHFLSEPARWAIYIPSVQQNHFVLFTKIFSFTAFVSYVFPLKMGLPLRILLLKNKANLNVTEISAFLLLDGCVYYALWGMSAVVMTLMITLKPSVFVYPFNIRAFLFIPIIVIILILLHFYIRRKKQYDSHGKTSKRIIFTIKSWLAEIAQLYQEIKPQVLVTAGLIICIDIASQILRHWALLNVLGYDLPWLDFSVVTCVSIFAGLISMMPMGLGGYDVVIVLLLTQAGIPFNTAIAALILNRFGNIVVSMLLGIWSGWELQMNPFNLSWVKKWVEQRKNHPE